MHILIEDAETFQYLDGDGQWTKDVSKGKNFLATQLAYLAAKKEPIGKFNIVSYIAQSKQFINLNHGKGKGAEGSAA